MQVHRNIPLILAILLLAILMGCPQEMDLIEAPAIGLVVDEDGSPIQNVTVHGSRSGANIMDPLLDDFHEQQLTDELGSFSLETCVRERYAVKNTGCNDSERVLDEIIDFEIAFTHPSYDTLIIAFVRYNYDTETHPYPYLSKVDSILHIDGIAWEKVDGTYEFSSFSLKSRVGN